ncbi:phage recombination protein Bet [Methanococcoides sp. FTZ1]|uniref:phage recombination protein Bet n=1 Tax=Methanococcoides sp. FTZ1 TaxID=3439061 RepID=UPI003F871A0B
MAFTEKTVGNQLELMGFKPDPKGVWKLNANYVIYVVNFKNQEYYKFDGTNVYHDDDPEDQVLSDIHQLIQSALNDQPESSDDERRDSNDATDQSAQEVPSEIKDVTIPNKNIVTAPNPDLTSENIRQYLCPTATDQEIFMFLQLCEHRKLNPFIKEAYLIKYNNSPATLVVGKDSFTKKAEDNPAFDGFEAGIIVKSNKADTEEDYFFEATRREGTFMMKGEELLGGWAKVYRKDRSIPFVAEVSMAEYNTGKSSWAKIPATMIRKVALVQALREAFPSDLGGCYDSSEMDQAGEN